MTDLRTAAQQALERLRKYHYGNGFAEDAECIADLEAALAQQDEPDLSRCPQCNGPADNGFDRSIPPSPYLCTKCMAEPVTEDMKSAVRWAPSSAYWSQRLREFFGPDAREGIDALERRLAKAQQDEPLNLSDPAVQKRLASQWGYVPAAAQAEPVEPVAWRFKPMIGSPWSLSDDGYYISCKRDKGYIVGPLYAAPPQRKLVPLTEEEIERIGMKHVTLREVIRAVERAHGIKEN